MRRHILRERDGGAAREAPQRKVGEDAAVVPVRPTLVADAHVCLLPPRPVEARLLLLKVKVRHKAVHCT